MLSYEIPSHISGDTWIGISSLTLLRDGSALNLSGAYLEMQVRFSIDSPPVLTLSTANSGIVITSPTEGIASIPTMIVDVPVSTYKYDLELTLSNGEKTTQMGGIWKILPSITRA